MDIKSTNLAISVGEACKALQSSHPLHLAWRLACSVMSRPTISFSVTSQPRSSDTDEPQIYQRGCRQDDLHRSQGNLFTTMTLDDAREWLYTTQALTLTASTSIILLRVYSRKVRLRRWNWSDWMNGKYSARERGGERQR